MNTYDLLNIKCKIRNSFLSLAIIYLIIIIYLMNISSYSYYSTKAYVKNNQLFINLLVSDNYILNSIDSVNIDNKKYKVKVVNISDVLIDENSMIMYQTVELAINKKLFDKQIIDISINYQLEKGYKKIKRLLF